MSRTPKRHEVWLDELRRRYVDRQRKKRERARDEERARREENAQKAAIESAKQSQTEAYSRLADVASSQPGAVLDDIVDALKNSDQALADAPSAKAARGAASGFKRVIDELEIIHEQRRVQQQGEWVTQRLATITRLLNTQIDAATRFEAAREAELRDEITVLAAMDMPGDAARRERQVDALEKRSKAHWSDVGEQEAQFRQRMADAHELVGDLRARYASIQADAEVAGLDHAVDSRVEPELDRISRLIAQEDPVDHSQALAAVTHAIDEYEVSVDAAVDRLLERREIMKTLVKVMPRAGYSVDPNSINESEGTLGFRALAMSGDGLAVVVQETDENDHRIMYAGSGVAHEEKVGQAGPACDSLVDVIRQLKVRLSSAGVGSGDITWDGPDGQADSARASSQSIQRLGQRRGD